MNLFESLKKDFRERKEGVESELDDITKKRLVSILTYTLINNFNRIVEDFKKDIQSGKNTDGSNIRKLHMEYREKVYSAYDDILNRTDSLSDLLTGETKDSKLKQKNDPLAEDIIYSANRSKNDVNCGVTLENVLGSNDPNSEDYTGGWDNVDRD